MIAGQRIAWDDIRSYRLSARLLPATHGLDGGIIDVSSIIDFWHALRGDRSEIRLSCELIGEQQRVTLDERFAIDETLQRIGPRLLASARDELARDRVATFGRLALARHGVQWQTRDPIAFEAVDQLALVDTTPVQLFVHAKQRAWPYAKLALDDVPNVLAMLALAGELGYRVRGRELLQLTCS
jgi:hypothetical protein